MLTLRNCVVNLVRKNVNSRHVSISCAFFAQQPTAQLSAYDVNLILRENEYTHSFIENDECAVHSYESNQLGSNNPCEDAHTQGSFVYNNGIVCGVFDGHGGYACAQVISKRLLRYLSAAFTDRDVLKNQIAKEYNSQSFIKCHNDKADFVSEIKDIYEESFKNYVQTISSQGSEDRVTTIENVFLRLDNDLSREALKHTSMRTLAVAMSGAVTSVACIENTDLYIANTGDCSAVLGSYDPKSNAWNLKKFTNEHNFDNLKEVQRILSEHPKEEQDTVLRNERLLGQLAPLRAFGDFRYKWANNIMEQYVLPAFGEQAIAPHYYTPPYLTAQPEVVHHALTPNDKFLVIASDGLWDFLSPSQVVSLVGEHMDSKKILKPLTLPSGEVSLGDISSILEDRKAGRSRKPLDENSATHLIRNALGGTDFGIEHSKISYYLSLPQDVVRLYRDDITITVIYFNSDYIEKFSTGTSQENNHPR